VEVGAPPAVGKKAKKSEAAAAEGDEEPKAAKKRKGAPEAEEAASPKKNKKSALADGGGEAAPEPAKPWKPEPKAKAKAKAKSKKKKKRRKKAAPLVVKEPEAALEYLRAWSAKQAGEGDGWRFNKATQAWLLRHAYDAERVAKAAFKLLLRYLEGLQGAARDRARRQAEAIVASGGARPSQEEETEADAGRPKARRKGRKAEEEAGGEHAEGGGADAAEKPTEAAEEATEAKEATEEEKAAEAKLRKFRVKRAKDLLAVLAEEA